jgi:hypothetical protein
MPSRAILPKKPLIFNAPKQRMVITGQLNVVAKYIQDDFKKTVSTWKHDVSFVITIPEEYTRRIATDDEIYGMLNAGTPEHLILPRNVKLLRFNVPFRAKTVPQQISSGPGSIGSQTVFSRGVNHPGTDARDWDITIALKWIDLVGKLFQDAIDEAVK